MIQALVTDSALAMLQRGASQARHGAASTSYASPNAFGSFASQSQEAASLQNSGLYRMFGGISLLFGAPSMRTLFTCSHKVCHDVPSLSTLSELGF